MEKTKTFVDSLFSGYEETKSLADFKEELICHLNDKIANFTKKGMSENEAFQKTTIELGDISVLADEMNLQRKQEIISEAFMDIRRFMKPWRVAAYVICGLFLAFGLICAAIAYFASDLSYLESGTGLGFLALFGVLLVFLPVSIGGFTWLSLTQESSTHYPMSIKRAIWYATAVLVLSAGLILLPITWLVVDGNERMVATIGVLIPFALPAIGLLVFLFLTEKDRKKPWVKNRCNSVNK